MSSDGATRPTIETVLERINAIGDALNSRIDALTARVDGLTSQVNEVSKNITLLRNDVEQGFRRVERKIQLLNNDFLETRTDQEDLLRRVESLEREIIERKAS